MLTISKNMGNNGYEKADSDNKHNYPIYHVYHSCRNGLKYLSVYRRIVRILLAINIFLYRPIGNQRQVIGCSLGVRSFKDFNIEGPEVTVDNNLSMRNKGLFEWKVGFQFIAMSKSRNFKTGLG